MTMAGLYIKMSYTTRSCKYDIQCSTSGFAICQIIDVKKTLQKERRFEVSKQVIL